MDKKEINTGDLVTDFVYWNSWCGMPDSELRIGVEFEVGGAYEDWGWVVEKKGECIASGRTLKEAIEKAKVYLEKLKSLSHDVE